MTSTILQNDVHRFVYRERVRLDAPTDPRSGQGGVIIRILENPSGRREHQWYDVRFDDGTYGRFLDRFLRTE
jgi:hypothetical protein